tara:strand:- start:136 stop:1359 length:1224 start_codon:yes stop_codon:yes gene_type:complete
VSVQIQNSSSEKELKIVSFGFSSRLNNNIGVTTNITPRGKSISRFLCFEDLCQTKPRQVVRARIIQIIDSKKLMIQAGNNNFKVEVENAENLKPGNMINLLAKNTPKGIIIGGNEFGLNTQKTVCFETIKPYLPARMPLSQMTQLLKNEVLGSAFLQDLKLKPEVLIQLKDTLSLLNSSEGKIPNAVQIKKQIEASGINYEAKVRKAIQSPINSPLRKELIGDLKGLLLKLYDSSERVSTKKSKQGSFNNFRQIIKKALDNVELNQLSNQISKQENQPLVIQIPNPVSSKNNTIQLFFRDQDSESADDSRNRTNKKNVKFFLDLSALGEMDINAQMGADNLTVRIGVKDEKVANFIRERKSAFEEKMNELKVYTCVECNVNKNVEPIKDSLTELLVNQNTPLINIKS